MPIKITGIKARPNDLEQMLVHQPALVELHCSAYDLRWEPQRQYEQPLALHVPEYTEQGVLLDPASTDETKRLLAQDVYVRAASKAAALGRFFPARKPLVVFHPGGATPAVRDQDKAARDARLEALGKTVAAMKAAGGAGAEILLENLPVSCCFFGGMWKANIVVSGQELLQLGERYGVGVTLDLCHLGLACHELGLNFLEEVAAALPRVRHVHYSDAKGHDGEGLEIGTGDLPLAAAFRLLEGLADVYAVPEIWFGHEQGGRKFVEAWAAVAKLTQEAVR